MNPFCDRYGSITDVDAVVMDACLDKACETFKDLETLNVCEIGMFSGSTARGIKAKVESLGMKINYFGIDYGFITQPLVPWSDVPSTIIQGKSEEVFHLVNVPLHFLFIDGCHCRNHVILDTVNYGSKVVNGGLILYHDASPEVQGTMRQPCSPEVNIPQFFTAVLEGLAMLHLVGWETFEFKYKPGCELGGIIAYRKTL